MTRASAAIKHFILLITAISAAVLTRTPQAQASILSKTLEDSIVYRVSHDGTPVIAGMIQKNTKIDILGYRPDFNWVRIRFEDDEGYVSKSTIEDPQLEKPYFDPEGDKLGRHKKGGNYDFALMNAKKFGHFRPAALAQMSINKKGNVGWGGGALIRSLSLAGYGHDIGVDGFLYLVEGSPFTASLFYRFWLGGKVKWGLEGAGSMTFLRFANPDGSTFISTSANAVVGSFAGIPLDQKFYFTPGVRFELTGSHGLTGIAAVSYMLK